MVPFWNSVIQLFYLFRMSSANELKEQGNKLFIAGKFKEAVSFYTKAIVGFVL